MSPSLPEYRPYRHTFDTLKTGQASLSSQLDTTTSVSFPLSRAQQGSTDFTTALYLPWCLVFGITLRRFARYVAAGAACDNNNKKDFCRSCRSAQSSTSSGHNREHTDAPKVRIYLIMSFRGIRFAPGISRSPMRYQDRNGESFSLAYICTTFGGGMGRPPRRMYGIACDIRPYRRDFSCNVHEFPEIPGVALSCTFVYTTFK